MATAYWMRSSLIRRPPSIRYYQNTGTAKSPVFQYIGPVTVSSTPANVVYHEEDEPHFGGNPASVAVADLDGDGMSEIVVSSIRSYRGPTTVFWNVPGDGNPSGPREFTYQDIYTHPSFFEVSNRHAIPFSRRPA